MGGQYSVSKNIRFKTPLIRSDLRDCNDAYIVLIRRVAVVGTKKLAFKSNAPFKSYISKINKTFIGNAQNLDIAMAIYNLLEYSELYSMTSGCFWNYYRDKMNDDAIETNADNYKTDNRKAATGKCFKYKTKIIGNTGDDLNILNKAVVAPLNCLSNFYRFFDLPLLNCKIKLDLSWSKDCKHLKYQEHIYFLSIHPIQLKQQRKQHFK